MAVDKEGESEGEGAEATMARRSQGCELCGQLIELDDETEPRHQRSGTGYKCGDGAACGERKRKRDEEVRNAPEGANSRSKRRQGGGGAP